MKVCQKGTTAMAKKRKAPPDFSNLSSSWNKGLKLLVKAQQTCQQKLRAQVKNHHRWECTEKKFYFWGSGRKIAQNSRHPFPLR